MAGRTTKTTSFWNDEDGIGREQKYRNCIEGPLPTKQAVAVLNVVKKFPVDAAEFSHGHAAPGQAAVIAGGMGTVS